VAITPRKTHTMNNTTITTRKQIDGIWHTICIDDADLEAYSLQAVRAASRRSIGISAAPIDSVPMGKRTQNCRAHWARGAKPASKNIKQAAAERMLGAEA